MGGSQPEKYLEAQDVGDECQDCGLELLLTIFIIMNTENVKSFFLPGFQRSPAASPNTLIKFKIT